MVEFLSLFLGLTFGLQTVELGVSPAVAAVELRLDGLTVERLAGPPWRAKVDFGSTLAPHRLEAVAFSRAGRELARASQEINLPRLSAEARLSLVADEAGQPRAVRLTWESLTGEPPTKLRVTFDGDEIPVEDPTLIPLPESRPSGLHFVSADLEFGDGELARTEVTFGGVYGSEVQTELTAVPVALDSKGELTLADLKGLLLVRGKQAECVAMEKGPAEVVFVRDAGAEPLLRDLRFYGGSQVRQSRYRSRVVVEPTRLRFDMKLQPLDRVRFLWPAVSEVAHPRFDTVRIFETSVALDVEDGGLYWFLTRLYPREERPLQQLADAVAVAGRRASAGHRRRAVVLVLGKDPEDQGLIDPVSARSYLASLRVPLGVWSAKRPKADAALAWGDAKTVRSLQSLRRAVADLERTLDRQRILWVEGRHLPREIELAPRAAEALGLRLLQ